MHTFRFWVDFAPKRVRDLIRFLSVKLTTGSRILEIVGLHAVGAKSHSPRLVNVTHPPECVVADAGLASATDASPRILTYSV